MAAGTNGGEFPPALRDYVIDDIRIGNEIGRGANGRILEAKWKGIVVAVKRIHSIFLNEVSDLEFESFKRSFLRECEQSSRLRHPNIVSFLGIYNPSGAKVPSLVMERLHCSLTSLLKSNPVVPAGIKLSIIKDVALGLRYLHTRDPPIIHRDLSSNNVLISKGMEGKIGDLGTARLVDPKRKSRMTKAPGTVDFMPPEAFEDVTGIRYGRKLDVFSFGCVMLHTLSHEWPTPSQAVIIDPETGLVTGGRSEVERRSKCFEKIDRSRSEVLIPLIESCLGNLPKSRPLMVRVCDQLEGQPIDRENILSNKLTMLALQQEVQHITVELQRKDSEIQRQNTELQRKDAEIQQKDIKIQQKDTEIQWKDIEIQQKDAELQQKDAEIQWKDIEIQQKDAELQQKDAEIQWKDIEIQQKDAELQQKDAELQQKDAEIQWKEIKIQQKDSEFKQKDAELQQKDAEIQRKDTEMQLKDAETQKKNGEIQRKDDEIQHLTAALCDKDVMLETQRSDMSEVSEPTKKVNKSSSDYWNSLKLTWQQCAKLPCKHWVTSVAALDEKVYAVLVGNNGITSRNPYVYDSSKDQWSILPAALPSAHFSLVTVLEKRQLLAIGGSLGDSIISNKVFLWDEQSMKWTTPYPNMPTARYSCSCISHGSSVIVAGGVTSYNPFTMTRAVEVLHTKKDGWFTYPHWSVVEQLPHVMHGAIPLIVDDKLYLAQGYDACGGASTCNVITASLSELLQNNNKNTSTGQVWKKLPDMPYISQSIHDLQGRLITFGGRHRVEQPDGEEPIVFKSVPLIHIYNPNTMTWDCVGEIPYEYLLWRSVCIGTNKILFIGGLSGTFSFMNESNILTTCSILTIST